MTAAACDTARRGRLAALRLVMLPAAYSGPEDFLDAGFAHAVRERGLDVDLVFAAVDLAHVCDRSVLTRLRAEHILPARAHGVPVWLGGISLGGFLALSLAAHHASELAGLCLFAPYLGSHRVTAEVTRAGGLGHWQPGDVAADDDERRVWSFIKTLRTSRLPMHLGLGREDRFAGRHRLMAAALAPESVDIVPGGHDWTTWRKLWERFLDARLARQPALAGHPDSGQNFPHG